MDMDHHGAAEMPNVSSASAPFNRPGSRGEISFAQSSCAPLRCTCVATPAGAAPAAPWSAADAASMSVHQSSGPAWLRSQEQRCEDAPAAKPQDSQLLRHSACHE